MPMNVVLQPAEDFTRENGKYLLEVYEGAKESPVATIEGAVESEDVMFFFNSTDGKTNLTIYMDELSESSLTLNDSDKGSFICR